MAEPENNFHFDIHPSTTQISGIIFPDGEAEVTFQVRNSGDSRKRAEVILEAGSATKNELVKDMFFWLQLSEPREYDYLPQSFQEYTVKIKVTGPVVPGSYSFRLKVVDHDNPDQDYLTSDEVRFKVASRPIRALPFVIGGIILLLLLTIGIIFLLLSSKSPSALTKKFTPPTEANVGQPVVYQLELKNTFAETAAENVVMEYTFPAGILGGWANVEWNTIDPPGVSTCGSTDTLLRCFFERIEPKQTATLKIYVLPGPLYPDQGISTHTPQANGGSPTGTTAVQTLQIDNTGRFTLRWMEKGTYMEDLDLAADSPLLTINPIDPKDIPVSGAAIPAVDVATVGLPVKISLIGWSNIKEENEVDLEYKLPQGMRFASIPAECTQQAGNYFILHCPAKSKVPVEIQVIPLQPSTGYVQNLRGRVSDKTEYAALITQVDKVPSLPAATNQMVFNGIDEWAQLGYSGLPDTKEFTVEMWVAPYSLEDGQALIGAHRHSEKNKEVQNLFLVGYYNGSINVNVMGDCQNLILKTSSESSLADPYHLAVVVKGYDTNNKRDIYVYKNGKPVDLDVLDKTVCCPNCRNIEWKPKPDEIDFNWVIGQDWDPNGSGIALSDFFHGAISNVRIYSRALPDNEVREDLYLPPQLYLPLPCKPKEKCVRPDLIGWWPLAKTSQAAADQQAECILPKTGNLPTETSATETPASGQCPLADMSLNHFDGARSGGIWGIKSASFGNALAFNGSSIVYNEKVLLSNFTEATVIISGAAKKQATATPTATLTPTSTKTFTPTPALTNTPVPNFQVSEVDLNGQRATVSVAPGESFVVSYDFHFTNNGCPSCRTQLVTDLRPSNTHGEKCEDYSPDVSKMDPISENVELIAPDQPGTYAVVVDYFQMNKCEEALANYDNGNGLQIGQIIVAYPKDTAVALRETALIPRETALAATATALYARETSVAATVTALNATPTPLNVTQTPVKPTPEFQGETMKTTGVPVTISAWVFVNAVPSKQQTILADSFPLDNEKVDIRLIITSDGHVQADYEEQGSKDVTSVRDEKAIPAGHWIHYAVVFWFDKGTGALIQDVDPLLYLFRDGQQVKATPKKENAGSNWEIADGLHLGGLQTSDRHIVEGFSGRIDEVRIWNRALYDPMVNTGQHIAPEIELWRRLPGVSFDEIWYWSFDEGTGMEAQGICGNNDEDCPALTVIGPGWIPNDLQIAYTE